MKTVKEIAFNLEVSQVTVYNHIKKLDKELKGNIFKIKGVNHLNDEGIRQLKISMGLIEVPTVKENVSIENIIDNISDQVIEKVTDNIKSDYESLRNQVEEISKQNNILIGLLEERENKTFIQKIKEIFKK